MREFEVIVKKIDEDHSVGFSIDHQTFRIHIIPDDEHESKERAEWYARQLRFALSRLCKKVAGKALVHGATLGLKRPTQKELAEARDSYIKRFDDDS